MSRKSIAALLAIASIIVIAPALTSGRRADTYTVANAAATPQALTTAPQSQTTITSANVSAPNTSTAPPHEPPERNALNTPPEILNSVNGLLIESQEVKPPSESVAQLTLTLKNVSAMPVAYVVFVRQREPATTLQRAAFSSADFACGEPFEPGTKITYHIALTDFEKPLVARVAAVVYRDASGPEHSSSHTLLRS